MHKSEFIDHVSTTALIDDALDAMFVIANMGNTISLLGYGSCMPIARAARQVRNHGSGAPVRIGASKGVRPAWGSPRAAALTPRAGPGRRPPRRRPRDLRTCSRA